MTRFTVRLALLVVVFLTPLFAFGVMADAPEYVAAMRPQFAADVDRPDLPHYDLDITIDVAARRLSGHLELSFPNTTGTLLRDVVLRLYPNAPRDMFGDGGNGNARVAGVLVNGVATTPQYEAQRTAVRLATPQPVRGGREVQVALDWQSTIEPLRGTDDTLPLPSSYPQLAVWENGWRTDVTRFPDHVYAVSSLYHVRVRVPSGWTTAASGSSIASTTHAGMTVSEFVTGPIREWAFTVGKFAVARSAHAGTSIAVYYRSGSGLSSAAQQIADHAAAALAVYNQHFGPYPFRALNFHLLQAGRGYDAGVEYPGLIFILLNRRYTAETRFVTAHEVAHQWFYGMLGDDIFNEPWLDEGFAQYSPLLVEEQLAGPAAVKEVYNTEIAPLAARAALPAGLSLAQYGTWNRYYAAVYGRGAQFLYTLRGEIGDAAFFNGLQEYVRTHKYGITHTADLRAAFEHTSGRDLRPLFHQWIGRE